MMDEMGGACSMYGRERRGLYRILTGKSEGKKPFGRPRSRWENNIKVNLTEIGWKGLVRLDLVGSC